MSETQDEIARRLLRIMLTGLGLEPGQADGVGFSGHGTLRGYYAYTDVLAASLAAAGLAVADLLETAGLGRPDVHVDRLLASGWANHTVQAVGRSQNRPSPFRIGGEYPTADGRWLRITDANLRLQQRMLAVLGQPRTVEAVAAEVRRHDADVLEARILEGGGAASASRTMAEWAAHPAGQAIAAEPLVALETLGKSDKSWRPTPGRPLAGIRVLDCTRAVAGPMATRLLAGFGAEVLRIDPIGYEEWDDRDPTQLTLGKRCARLDLASDAGRQQFIDLLAETDVFVHGFRPGVFEQLGLGAEVRGRVRPDLVEIVHNAYGWTGPWANRRGFDSTVYTSSGLLVESMTRAGVMDPKAPGVTQHVVVDHGVGQMEAASAIRGLTRRLLTGQGSRSKLSLAGNTRLLGLTTAPDVPVFEKPAPEQFEERLYNGTRGPLRRLRSPIDVAGNPFFWERPGELYGSSTATWAGLRL
jgi:crotonobetainyl-CoA:carnitine CoA-transferase CaiB-like acyl-CoA transferase